MNSIVILFTIVCFVAGAQSGLVVRTIGTGAGDGIVTIYTGLDDANEAVGTSLNTVTDVLNLNIPGAVRTALSGTTHIVQKTVRGALIDTGLTVTGGLGDLSDLLHLRII